MSQLVGQFSLMCFDWMEGERVEIHQQKDETFMKKVSFCRMSYINARSLVYESPNWIYIFDVPT